jgi:hypothetical protein
LGAVTLLDHNDPEAQLAQQQCFNEPNGATTDDENIARFVREGVRH